MSLLDILHDNDAVRHGDRKLSDVRADKSAGSALKCVSHMGNVGSDRDSDSGSGDFRADLHRRTYRVSKKVYGEVPFLK